MGIRPASLGNLAVASAVQALLVAPAPFLVKRAFEIGVGGGTALALAAAVGWLVALLLASEGMATLVKLAALRVTKPGTERLRAELASAITRLPADLVEPQSPSVHDVYVHDTERIDAMLSAATGHVLPSLLLIAGLSVALGLAHPGFGLVTLVAAASVASVERVMRRTVRKRLDESHRAFGEFSRGAWSMLAGFLVTRSHAAETDEAATRAAEARVARRAGEAAARTAAIATLLGRATAAVVFGSLLLLAGLLVQRGSMSVPAMLAVMSTIALLRAPLFMLGQMAPQVQEGWRAWRRVAALLEAAESVPTGGVPPPEGAAIVLDDLECRYGRKILFQDVSLRIEPGEFIALTGPNGAGKTTLVRQLLGLAAPTAGTIRVGDVPLDMLDIGAWRRSVGVVLQETWFFDGSILENLTYGAPSATKAIVEESCRIATADQFLCELPAGLDTRIGTDGLRLSWGQRQRLAIARALVRQPRLLILDEPTNHLDDVTARAILEAILGRPNRPAILLVTHRLQFAALADRVHRLAGGRLTALDRVRVQAK